MPQLTKGPEQWNMVAQKVRKLTVMKFVENAGQ